MFLTLIQKPQQVDNPLPGLANRFLVFALIGIEVYRVSPPLRRTSVHLWIDSLGDVLGAAAYVDKPLFRVMMGESRVGISTLFSRLHSGEGPQQALPLYYQYSLRAVTNQPFGTAPLCQSKAITQQPLATSGRSKIDLPPPSTGTVEVHLALEAAHRRPNGRPEKFAKFFIFRRDFYKLVAYDYWEEVAFPTGLTGNSIHR